jgi:hypothetical protein
MLDHKHEYEALIHERHLDTFGHVNNAAYLEILEEALGPAACVPWRPPRTRSRPRYWPRRTTGRRPGRAHRPLF